VVPGMSHEKCIWKESRARRDRLAATSMSAAGRPGERNQTSGTNPDALTRSVHGPKLVSEPLINLEQSRRVCVSRRDLPNNLCVPGPWPRGRPPGSVPVVRRDGRVSRHGLAVYLARPLCRRSTWLMFAHKPCQPASERRRSRDVHTAGRKSCIAFLPRAHPALAHPVATGIATKCVASPDLIRIRIACLPADLASATARRTSEGVFTALPETSRITSPARMHVRRPDHPH
jgi:hypothetical protein